MVPADSPTESVEGVDIFSSESGNVAVERPSQRQVEKQMLV
jgi:hypothetical protein